jgi:hypothetical protein
MSILEIAFLTLSIMLAAPWLVYVCVKLAVVGYYKGKELSNKETNEDGQA